MTTTTGKDITVSPGQYHITKNNQEVIKAVRVASSVVIVAYDPSSGVGGMAHIGLPDSKMGPPGDSPLKYVDKALPQFIDELFEKGASRTSVIIDIIGGSQLFNFGGGGGNILNIGTRNAITARTILTRAGIQVEKTETGGNKVRTVLLEMETGYIQVFHPGETPRYL